MRHVHLPKQIKSAIIYFGHKHLANYLKFVLQNYYVYHPCTVRNLSFFSEKTSEKKISPPGPLTIRFFPQTNFV